jgi:5'-nucleotidase
MAETKDDRVALIDLDGTVADYDGAMQRELEKLRAPEEPAVRYERDPPVHIENRSRLIRRQPGFWRELARIPLGFEVVDELRELGFMLHVLTAGPKSSMSAWTEKAEWCREHLPDAFVTVTQDKSLVYGRVLVDDWPPYFEKWLAVRPRGLVIAVAHEWNAHVTHPSVLRYTGKNRAELRAALKAAYDREKPGA